ncbi:venom allergen 4-like [Pseudomyrmex gracilis]|uniref:venom allergen 4-like n=1 Tax=Pseudomyrmex gracilis TaxID=219809 RepID=UPI00099572DE|nr:venom allergen 4-like [Pseudomyrmex gracilis]
MKTFLFMFCVLMAIYAYALSTKRPTAYYDSVEACFENITSNKNINSLKNLNISQPIPKNEYDDLVNASICAFKKDGVITPEGTLSKSSIYQYCAQVFLNSEKILKCQTIVKHCTDLECSGSECTPEEVKPYIECAINNNILSLLDFSL